MSNIQKLGAKFYNFSDRLYYLYKRNNWFLDLSRFYASFDDVSIDRPIFMLGTQGGGLTLISRMLRRNVQIVSVSGDYTYWAGADEMQVVLEPILDSTLIGIKHKAPYDPMFGTPRGWLYATDRLLPLYRATQDNATPEMQEEFQKLLKWIIKRHAKGRKHLRFIDKSQLYTVKVSYLAALLEGSNPKFLLVTRDPYAMCYRATLKVKSLRMLADRFDFNQRLEFAAQHWANSMSCALADAETVHDFMIVQFENVLMNPEAEIKKICEFLELDYNRDMIPQHDHTIPFGSMRRERWYPLKPDINTQYLQKLEEEHIEIIAQKCETIAERFGYQKPVLARN